MGIWEGQSYQLYNLPPVKEYLEVSNGGDTAYIWMAEYVDGTVLSQFSPELSYQFQADPAFVPVLESGLSIKELDEEQVKEFILAPTAHARQYLPWLTPVHIVIDRDKGEKFISYRLVYSSSALFAPDGTPVGTGRVVRFVVGISREIEGVEFKVLTVLSPSGLVTVTSNDLISYEGE